jgi:hypothetical protein
MGAPTSEAKAVLSNEKSNRMAVKDDFQISSVLSPLTCRIYAVILETWN